MKTLVVDSSVMVKWVSVENETNIGQANKILSDTQAGKVSLIAPELAKYEIGNALLKKGLTVSQAIQSLGTIYGSPVKFVSETEDLAGETYQLAQGIQPRENRKLTYYDVAFVALAKAQSATLVTDNPKHQSKIKGVKVTPLKQYK